MSERIGHELTSGWINLGIERRIRRNLILAILGFAYRQVADRIGGLGASVAVTLVTSYRHDL